MSKLTIRAQTKSKAKLVDKFLKVRHFIVGQKYDIKFVVKNIGDKPSPSVKFKYHINWPQTPASTTNNFDVKSLESGKCHESETKTYMALSTGLATIIANAYTPKPENKKIRIWSKEYKKYLGPSEACGTIYSTTPEAIYTYWALWLAAAGLFLNAVNWNLCRLLWLSALLLIFIILRSIWNFLRARACKDPSKWGKKKDNKIKCKSSRNGDLKIIEGVILALYGNWLINYLNKINFHPGVNLNYVAITFFTLVSILSVILTVQYLIQGDQKKYFISWSVHFASIVFIVYVEYLQSTYTISQFFSEFVKMYVIGFGLWGLLPIYGRTRARKR